MARAGAPPLRGRPRRPGLGTSASRPGARAPRPPPRAGAPPPQRGRAAAGGRSPGLGAHLRPRAGEALLVERPEDGDWGRA
eukprot:1886285-Alexandrium_andersonii.AAC.1